VSDAYEAFVKRKRVEAPRVGFEPADLPPHLFPHQRDCLAFACRTGRSAIFADTGLGKTAMQIEWARQVCGRTGGAVLILAPLAVAQQTVREAARFGVEVVYAQKQPEELRGIVITNYERLKGFDPSAFAGVVLDESSILKSFMGQVKRDLVASCASVPYRLACTATPAPNDHLELGNHAEFLGVMTSHEMIARWFINDTSSFGVYRLKGHAVEAFWDWVHSWAVCIGMPSDMGHDDAGYVLPELHLERHVVDADTTQDTGGLLFRVPEMSATSVHREKRLTVAARAAEVARLVAAEPTEQWVVWCETDYEADALTSRIADAVEVRGSDRADAKERAALDFEEGRIRVLVTKASIFGFGLNWQHCARVAFVGATFSYETFYQAIRRSWRFGQSRPVDVHVVMAQTEASVWSVLNAKREGNDEMRSQMRAASRRAAAKAASSRLYVANDPIRIPSWLVSEEKREV